MNRLWIAMLVFTTFAWSGCTPPPPEIVKLPPQQPTPMATPRPTPHPASGAMEAAIKLYPDLSKPTSHFARTFREIKEDVEKKTPVALSGVDWPLTIARRTAAMLGVEPFAEAPPKQPNMLEKGAYDQRRNRSRRDLEFSNSPTDR